MFKHPVPWHSPRTRAPNPHASIFHAWSQASAVHTQRTREESRDPSPTPVPGASAGDQERWRRKRKGVAASASRGTHPPPIMRSRPTGRKCAAMSLCMLPPPRSQGHGDEGMQHLPAQPRLGDKDRPLRTTRTRHTATATLAGARPCCESKSTVKQKCATSVKVRRGTLTLRS